MMSPIVGIAGIWCLLGCFSCSILIFGAVCSQYHIVWMMSLVAVLLLCNCSLGMYDEWSVVMSLVGVFGCWCVWFCTYVSLWNGTIRCYMFRLCDGRGHAGPVDFATILIFGVNITLFGWCHWLLLCNCLLGMYDVWSVMMSLVGGWCVWFCTYVSLWNVTIRCDMFRLCDGRGHAGPVDFATRLGSPMMSLGIRVAVLCCCCCCCCDCCLWTWLCMAVFEITWLWWCR